jgi:quaternary ammonium compound-resistance protein SugE
MRSEQDAPVPQRALAFKSAIRLSLKTVSFGTAYAIWTGIAAVGTVALGIYMFGEPADVARLTCIALILTGIVGLKLVTQ